MTESLYLTDSYLKEFAAVTTAVDPVARTIVLDRTAFYPGGGGQQPDAGELLIDGQVYKVTSAKKQGGDILHYIGSDTPLPGVGTIVTGRLDWERRYKTMRTHTAMHILCGTIWHDYQVSVTGGNMELLTARMDFEFDDLSRETIAEIEQRINTEVNNARPVQVHILPRAEAFKIPDLIRTKINLLPEGIQEVRVIEIVGLDLQADGGTHVKNTSEVGTIHITDYQSKGKANKRLYIEIDE